MNIESGGGAKDVFICFLKYIFTRCKKLIDMIINDLLSVLIQFDMGVGKISSFVVRISSVSFGWVNE